MAVFFFDSVWDGVVSKRRLLQPCFPYYLLKETGGINTEGENPGGRGCFLAILGLESVCF